MTLSIKYRGEDYFSSQLLKTIVIRPNKEPEMTCQTFFALLFLLVRNMGEVGLIDLLYSFMCMLAYIQQCVMQMHICMIV